ncbi:MAG: exonuclease domain-containing protein [Bacteroidetes bacterium]|nr:exonuclease domain-containing protein [Bacteroidota bacterium]
MNFIVFDLEATCWKGSPPSKVQEVIEIGAIHLNYFGEVKGVFNRFIRPLLNPNLSAFCTELTTIEQDDVYKAALFPKVIEEFQHWANIFEEDYVLCSWGYFDKKILIQDCRLHDMEDDWLDPHINLKRQYQELKKLKKAWGLKRAVISEGFEFTGIHHRAIADADNTAKIVRMYMDEWRY